MIKAKIVPKDIRSLAPKRLAHFTVPQGACSDGEYIYIAFERKEPHRIKIVKMDKTMCVVAVSGAMKIGHANDLCVRDGIIYATHSAGSKTVHRIDAKTLKKKKGVKVKGRYEFNGISCYGKNKFILRVMGGRSMLVVSSDFKVIRHFKTDTSYVTSQGMTMDGSTLVRAYSRGQSAKNYIVEYSPKGKEKSRHRVDLAGEMECVFVMDGERFVTTYIKKDGKKKAYIAKLST